jgi:hypothetical protein
MNSKRILTASSVDQAIEITKVAIASQNGHWIDNANMVATFIETVAEKIENLRHGVPDKH